MNEFDEAFEKGRADARANKPMRKPRDEFAWRMFKSEDQKFREQKLNRSYVEGYEKGRKER